MALALTIVSGAQTGVDTAGIKTAVKLHIPYRGWVPLGFTNEAGPILGKYRADLRETPSEDNAERTKWNVQDADFVLTILKGSPESAIGGTAWAVSVARKAGKEIYFVDLGAERSNEVDRVRRWLRARKLKHLRCTINGPRESEEPGIEEEATMFLCEALADL